MNLKDKAESLKKDIPAVFLSLKDNDTPVLAKIFAGITIMYALSPIDLIPDFISLIGYLDDILLLPLLVALTIKFIPADILEKNRKKAENLWKNGKPKKWYYSIPIIFIWLVIIIFLIKVILNK